VPILMKKGRPAYTLRVLTAPGAAEAVQRIVFAQTSAIGLRRIAVEKVALPRETVTVEVGGEPIRVKLARSGDQVVNAQPEWDDVAAAARRTGRPAKAVLAQALAAYWRGGPAGTTG